ncbi:hypothetical protein [Neptunomonas qingdaonensis]|uniref:hypothetical protein n=1 Tax=Neptunomonas qingdaonensis TaxID=1045558 RepID=UPI000B89C1BB|nr:hypothetical protein [Neptunomonas qingdaonensis]
MPLILGYLVLNCLLVSYHASADVATPDTASDATSDTALQGEKTISLLDKAGNRTEIARVIFEPVEQGSRYVLTMEREQFRDYFLSMKEMKCLEGPELWCHLAYPYEQPRIVTADDLRWLEHDLLFMFKTPKEFGANFWNGIYYKLEVVDGMIKGEAQAIDLNNLASPPDNLDEPPIGEAERDEVDTDKRWLPLIEIH